MGDMVVEPVVELSPLPVDGGSAVSTEDALVTLEPVEPPFSELASKNPYLVYVGGLDESSVGTMRSAAKLVVKTLTNDQLDRPEDFPWSELDYGVVRRLRQLLRQRLAENGEKLAPATVNKALVCVRSIAKEAWLLGRLPHEEYQRILQVKNLVSHRLPAGRMVERDEVAKMLEVCFNAKASERTAGMRDAAIVSILAGAGLRENESVHVLRPDLHVEKGSLHVRHGKHHRERLAYLERAFTHPMNHYLAHVAEVEPQGESDPVLVRLVPAGSIYKPYRSITTQAVHLSLGRLQERLHLAPFTPHDLRRSFITTQLDYGVDALRLARAVGHQNPKTTLLYDRRTAESDREAIQALRENDPVAKLFQGV